MVVFLHFKTHHLQSTIICFTISKLFWFSHLRGLLSTTPLPKLCWNLIWDFSLTLGFPQNVACWQWCIYFDTFSSSRYKYMWMLEKKFELTCLVPYVINFVRWTLGYDLFVLKRLTCYCICCYFHEGLIFTNLWMHPQLDINPWYDLQKLFMYEYVMLICHSCCLILKHVLWYWFIKCMIVSVAICCYFHEGLIFTNLWMHPQLEINPWYDLQKSFMYEYVI